MQQQIPSTILLDIALSAGANHKTGKFPDVFADPFRYTARRIAQTECKPRKDNIFLVGYFTDNNLHWIPDGRRKQPLLYDYLAFPKDSEGYKRSITFLKERYNNTGELNQAWNIKAKSMEEITVPKNHPTTEVQKKDEQQFLGIIAEQYFRVTNEAIRAYDPNHLILGCRFDELTPENVLNAMKKYVDVISLNTYQYPPPVKILEAVYGAAGKPLLISEFSLKAADSGLPNTVGRGYVCTNQQDRANGYRFFIEKILSLPYVIGYHWYSYMDEPLQGRWDGENNNYGLVNNEDTPWKILTDQIVTTNQSAESIHATGKK